MPVGPCLLNCDNVLRVACTTATPPTPSCTQTGPLFDFAEPFVLKTSLSVNKLSQRMFAGLIDRLHLIGIQLASNRNKDAYLNVQVCQKITLIRNRWLFAGRIRPIPHERLAHGRTGQMRRSAARTIARGVHMLGAPAVASNCQFSGQELRQLARRSCSCGAGPLPLRTSIRPWRAGLTYPSWLIQIRREII